MLKGCLLHVTGSQEGENVEKVSYITHITIVQKHLAELLKVAWCGDHSNALSAYERHHSRRAYYKYTYQDKQPTSPTALRVQ